MEPWLFPLRVRVYVFQTHTPRKQTSLTEGQVNTALSVLGAVFVGTEIRQAAEPSGPVVKKRWEIEYTQTVSSVFDFKQKTLKMRSQ